jgi:hypothetical protein
MTNLELAIARLSASLPFPLTDAQRAALVTGNTDALILEDVFAAADELAIDAYFCAVWA